jgi:serine phosphatase RsbU (regulator of sigma subunit)
MASSRLGCPSLYVALEVAVTTANPEPDTAPELRVGRVRPITAGLAVLTIGAVITASSAAIAATLNARNEHSLLEVQTKQAAAVLSGAILAITGPLDTALRVAQTTHGDGASFTTTMARVTGPDRVFVSAAMWDTASTPARVVARVGGAPELSPSSATAAAFVARAQRTPTFVVTNPGAAFDRVAYARADTAEPRYVVYAERAVPASRVTQVQRGAAFSALNFATYLGTDITPAALVTTNLPVSQLPLTGDVVTVPIAFGDTTLTLVATEQDRLGGELGGQLPLIFLLGGLALTAVTAIAVTGIMRSRRRAEEDGATIAGLYAHVDELYQEQRGIAETLQRALLPLSNPDVASLDIASRYVAGANGVDVGGDWYSLVRLDDDRVGFVVGDVSGRGISAAAVMARLRFTIRAYLIEGHDPGTALDLCSRQFDISEDGHFATVLVGVTTLSTREVVLANAGHFPPLILTGSHSEYADTVPSPPLGTGPRTHTTTTLVMPAGSTLVAFTDGLIERRTESLDVGLERLTRMTLRDETGLDEFLDATISDLTHGKSEDDIAVLAFRWHPAAADPEPSDASDPDSTDNEQDDASAHPPVLSVTD